eukprot:TRINITY_DN93732_c0_g1_i1.p1 TRINITY_DN93732_c0_g1~~TRINITY_DN93732_c0_g1_i1.p1  ORF type:complete len:322 (-),score=11.76 TRINITY_DN93732_c0_g1_i1:78-1043(-)
MRSCNLVLLSAQFAGWQVFAIHVPDSADETQCASDQDCSFLDELHLLQVTRQVIGSARCIGCCERKLQFPPTAMSMDGCTKSGAYLESQCAGRCVGFCSGLKPSDFVARGASAEHDVDESVKQSMGHKALSFVSLSSEIAAKSVAFVGSSQFAMWRRLQEDFPGYPVLNAAVRGSQSRHWLDHDDVNDVLWRWKPGTIVFYCGSNDVQRDQGSAADIAARLIEFYHQARAKLSPSVRFVFVGVLKQPDFVLRKLLAKTDEVNQHLSHFQSQASDPELFYVDTNMAWASDPQFYICDGIHLTDEGHSLLGDLIRPVLPAAHT